MVLVGHQRQGKKVGQTVESSSTGSVDDPSEFLFAEMWPSSLCARERALEMNFNNSVPFLVASVENQRRLKGIRKLTRTLSDIFLNPLSLVSLQISNELFD